jgi:hypothetical protein
VGNRYLFVQLIQHLNVFLSLDLISFSIWFSTPLKVPSWNRQPRSKSKNATKWLNNYLAI